MSARIDYEYKNKVLNQYPNLDKDIRLITRGIYLFSINHSVSDKIVKKALKVASKYYYNPEKVIVENAITNSGLIRYPYENPIKECIRLNNAYYSRKRRLQKHLTNLFSKGNCLFLTLTFRDDVFKSTSFKTRRQYVYRFLKSFSDHYVANVDYGDEHDREHYHAVILLNRYPVGSWPYGWDYVENCKTDLDDKIRLSKYISKLTNHAYKESAKRYSIIYSK